MGRHDRCLSAALSTHVFSASLCHSEDGVWVVLRFLPVLLLLLRLLGLSCCECRMSTTYAFLGRGCCCTFSSPLVAAVYVLLGRDRSSQPRANNNFEPPDGIVVMGGGDLYDNSLTEHDPSSQCGHLTNQQPRQQLPTNAKGRTRVIRGIEPTPYQPGHPAWSSFDSTIQLNRTTETSPTERMCISHTQPQQ